MSLSTLIVQREIASIREVEEALARQVLYGGDLITNLLEVCRLDEAQLLPIVAESLGLPPAPPGELPRPDAEAMRLVAAEVAAQRNLAPLSVDRYGLVLAVAEPLSPDLEQELSFALALPISQKIAPLVRIRQALNRDYGLPLDRRLQRLLQKMTGLGPRTSSSFPPLRAAEILLGAPRPPSGSPAGPRPLAPSPVRPAVPIGGGPRTLVRSTEAPPARPLRRRRGAITVELAKAELEEAGERDTIFDLVFEFARQYFDYTAVFIVHGEVAEGRDSFGDGAPRDRVARIGVPLDMPNVLAMAREKKAILQKLPAREGLDAILMADLGRAGTSVVIVVPVIVRTRVVALLLGDGGETGIDQQTLADVEGIITSASAAFERLIVRRKLKGTFPPGTSESTMPRGLSMGPPTKLSEVSDRPSVEELAPPIRELMEAPVSLASATMRDPVVQAIVPMDSALGRGSTDKPPPLNVLLRRPSGAPIPREEPDATGRVPAVTAPSNLGPAAKAAAKAVYGPSGPSSSGPRSQRRREAPKLDFNPVPSSSAMFGGGFGADPAERELLDEIHGHEKESERPPPTSRDATPPRLEGEVTFSPLSVEVPPPSSPKAASPALLRATPPPNAASITDRSPLPMFAAVDAPPATPPMAPSAPVLPAASSAPAPPSSGLVIEPQDSDVSMVSAYEVDLAPITPMVDMDGLTPLSPPASWTPPGPPVSAARSSPRAAPPVPEPIRTMPPSEQQISVAAHRPPSSRNSDARILPSVIVDVASEYVSLVARVIAGAADTTPGLMSADDAEAELLRAGGHAMPAIMERFPGPVTIESERLMDGPLPRVAECGPVLRLVASQRRTALPFVLAHVEDPNLDRRFWATYLLTELVYPDVLEPILLRVFDMEPMVRRVARAAARAFADAHPATIVERLELVAMDAAERRDRRVLAIEALGETREVLAVPALIPQLDDPDVAVVNAVRAALGVITRQDFGTSSQRWSAWWTQNYDRHRLEWLIDALMHDQAALRAAAGEELKTTTKEYFGYYDDLPKRERERAQSRYREWWNSVGRVRFSRSSASRRG